ncbi:MAG: aspartate carbamoyltransferase catalytic subunit, partial [Candidatus Omnitrophota bacterium]
AKRLSADVMSISAQGSSLSKGESLKDMARNIEAMKVDVLVVRHSAAGSCHFLARALRSSVINAGDGAHEHPTQALLDIFTIEEKKKKIEGLKVSILGDILHSRVARSNIWGLLKLGAEVTICGPRTLLPVEIERMAVRTTCDLDEAIRGADVLNILRVQLERQKGAYFPSLREYAQAFCVTRERLESAKKDILILHPGPMNRGVEIAPDVADGPYSVILNQVTNGVAVRMAVLFHISQAGSKEEGDETAD